MDSLSELKQAIESLPKGNLYQKTIRGFTYWYRQYNENGKRISLFVAPSNLERLQKEIAKRKELEEEYRRRVAIKDATLSLLARQKTGYVMSGDIPVAFFEEGKLRDLDETKAPLALVRTHDLDQFLKYRVIDLSRTNARLLKKALDISTSDETLISLVANGACIGDDYWFKPKHSKLHYKDIAFSSDALFDMSLKGETTFFPGKKKLSPELTTTGSFEKGWKRINGEWWLYKRESKQAVFSELYCYLISKKLGVPSAVYEVDGAFIRSKNFTSTMNFEPMAALVGDEEDYETILTALEPYGEDIQSAYLRLLFFDALLNNVDRHNENCGLMRERGSGKVTRLAPSFDCNLALVSRNPFLSKEPTKDGLIQMLVKFIRKNGAAKALFSKMEFVDIAKEDFASVFASIPTEFRIENEDDIAAALEIRYRYLRQAILP